MAKQVSLNQLFQGQSGRIGNYVLRIIDGQTYISVRPKKRTRTSDLQKQQMSRFKLAIKWANEHKHDPEFVLAAQQTKRNGINSYNLAIKKALSDPSILDNFTQTISQPDAKSTTSYTTTYTTITPTKFTTKSTPSTRVLTSSLKAFIFSLIILITTTLTTSSQTLNHTQNVHPITLPFTPTTEQHIPTAKNIPPTSHLKNGKNFAEQKPTKYRQLKNTNILLKYDFESSIRIRRSLQLMGCLLP